MTTIPAKQSKLREALKNNYVKTAILIAIVIGGVLSFWFGIKAVLRTEYPFMAVASPSMDDPIMHTLRVGDLIFVQGYVDLAAIYAAPKPNGDIVVFWHWDSYRGLEHWVHRAIDKVTVGGKTYLITQGDANYGSDNHLSITEPHTVLPGLPEEYVVGKVVANVPVIGQVALFLQTPSGRIIIVALVVALLIVEFIPFSKWRKKEQAPEQEQVEA